MQLLFSPLGRFRLVAFLEGVSYVVLLFICTPLKHFANFHEPVRYTGWAHGVLFILYIALLIHVHFANGWSIVKSGLAFLASLIPFGTFAFEWYLQKEEARQPDAQTSNE